MICKGICKDGFLFRRDDNILTDSISDLDVHIDLNVCLSREKVLESHFNWMNFTIFLYFPFKSLSNLRTLCNLVYSIWSILTKWVLRVLPCAFCQTLYKSGSQGIFDFTITYVAYLFLISSLINLLVVKNRSSFAACLIPKRRYMYATYLWCW